MKPHRNWPLIFITVGAIIILLIWQIDPIPNTYKAVITILLALRLGDSVATFRRTRKYFDRTPASLDAQGRVEPPQLKNNTTSSTK